MLNDLYILQEMLTTGNTEAALQIVNELIEVQKNAHEATESESRAASEEALAVEASA